MHNLPNSAREKLKTAFILILLFWQPIYSQKNVSSQTASVILHNCWALPLNNSTDIGIASDNDNVLYFSLVEGKVLAFDLETGKKRWETELGGDIIALPVINGDWIYTAAKYITEERKNLLLKGEQNTSSIRDENKNGENKTIILRALDKTTGVTRWQSALAPAEKLFLFNFEDCIVSVSDNGQMDSVGKIDGKIAWRKQLNTNLSAPPLVKNAEIFLGTVDNRILKLSLADGRIMQQTKTFAPPTVFMENTAKDKLIVGDRKGNLLSMSKRFDEKTKTIEWRFRIGAEISSINTTVEGLLVSSFDNFVYLVSEDGGKPLWKKRFSGRIIAAPLIAGDYFIVSATDESIAVIAELNGGRSVNKLSLNDGDFFTGLSLRTKNILVFSTLKGVFGYSFDGGDCRINRKSEEQKDER